MATRYGIRVNRDASFDCVKMRLSPNLNSPNFGKAEQKSFESNILII